MSLSIDSIYRWSPVPWRTQSRNSGVWFSLLSRPSRAQVSSCAVLTYADFLRNGLPGLCQPLRLWWSSFTILHLEFTLKQHIERYRSKTDSMTISYLFLTLVLSTPGAFHVVPVLGFCSSLWHDMCCQNSLKFSRCLFQYWIKWNRIHKNT